MKFKIILILTTVLLLACTQVESNTEAQEADIAVSELALESEGYLLMKAKCFVCHNPTAESHDALLAPPMVAVKRRYKMEYDTQDAFINGFVNWSIDPKEENALMRGAVKNFKIMPNLAFEADEMKLIAEYIWDNELEKPEWFDAHFKEEHPNGMGGGKGKRRAMEGQSDKNE